VARQLELTGLDRGLRQNRSDDAESKGGRHGDLRARRIAILATDVAERVELEQPRQAVSEAGADVELLSIHDGDIAARSLEDAAVPDVVWVEPSARAPSPAD
jgi:hypothetical protein